MSGEPESNVDEKIAELDKLLDDYSTALGTAAIQNDKDIETILEMSHEHLKLMDGEECGIWSFRVARYASFLQKEINRHTAKNKWAEHNLKIIVAKNQANYGDKYTKHEVKRDMIIAENSYAQVLNKMILQTMLRVEELNFLSTRIHTMSTILLDISKSKRYDN